MVNYGHHFEFRKNWLVIRHEKHLPSKLDDNMRSRIRNTMYEKWINKQVLSLLDQIRFKKIQMIKIP